MKHPRLGRRDTLHSMLRVTYGCRLAGMATNVEFEVDVRDVEYQRLGGKPWLARVYQPKGAGPFPTIVDVHGGAWHNGDRTSNAGICAALAAHGVLVAALDFRQPPEAGYPASMCDINFRHPHFERGLMLNNL